jgi:hypothetical protein|tara:strand:- start:8420 stop:8593 length:174 start_codon:yes stop_codon:yes gene_type:complete
MKYKEATPEEIKEWHETDYWMKMDFDPLVMFVVIPTIIQISALAFMFAVMSLNNVIF